MIQINFNVNGDSGDVPAELVIDNGHRYPCVFDGSSRMVVKIDQPEPSPYGAHVEWKGVILAYLLVPPPGAWEASMDPCDLHLNGEHIDVLYFQPPFPAMPSREQVCGVRLHLQGMTITTQQYGERPWFDIAYQCCGESDRASVRAQKKAAGDTHQVIEFFTRSGQSIYNESDVWLQRCLSLVGEDTPDAFRALVEETIRGGLTPVIAYDGDNGMDPRDGAPNALRQLPILTALLQGGDRDLTRYCLFVRFWDGVFYPCPPEVIQGFGTAFRALLPNGYLGIEHNPGHIPVGEGGDDYQPGGRMDAYDVIFSEFEDSSSPGAGNDTIWQIVGRMVQPYIRPADQPSWDDPNPPFYLVASPRGPRFYVAFEFNYAWGAYGWTRYYCTAAEVETHRNYMRGLGCAYVG